MIDIKSSKEATYPCPFVPLGTRKDHQSLGTHITCGNMCYVEQANVKDLKSNGHCNMSAVQLTFLLHVEYFLALRDVKRSD